MSFIHLVEPQRGAGRFPLFALGFRPFFLLAALFAAVSVPLWLLAYRGMLEPESHLPAFVWHGHEMVFGFATAVIAGFLLTAAANWTGRRTASGLGLAALAGLWLAGRIAVFCGAALPAWRVSGSIPSTSALCMPRRPMPSLRKQRPWSYGPGRS